MLTQLDHNNSIFSDKRETDLLEDETLENVRIQRSTDKNAFAVSECNCIQVIIDGRHDEIKIAETESVILGRADMLHSSLDLFDLHSMRDIQQLREENPDSVAS